MKYFLPMEDQKEFGRIPVYDDKKNIKYFLLGVLSQISSTVFLQDFNRQERGQISYNGDNLQFSYVLSLNNLGPILVRSAGTLIHPIFYLNKLNYFVLGNLKKGSFTINHGFKKIGKISTVVTSKGKTLKIITNRDANDEAIILLTALLTTVDTSSIKIKQPTKVTALQPSLFKFL